MRFEILIETGVADDIRVARRRAPALPAPRQGHALHRYRATLDTGVRAAAIGTPCSCGTTIQVSVAAAAATAKAGMARRRSAIATCFGAAGGQRRGRQQVRFGFEPLGKFRS